MDLQNKSQEERFKRNLYRAGKRLGDLDPVEEKFVLQMDKEYKDNGKFLELSVKQFNWLKQIAENW